MSIPTQSPRKFLELGPDVFISHPTASSTSQNDPSIILIFAWMSATIHHLRVYTEGYDTLYPGAVQIVVLSREKYFWCGKAQRDAPVEPAKKALKDLGIDGTTDLASSPRLLVHMFSMGGCLQFMTLAHLIANTRSGESNVHPAIPASALILDSCPGIADHASFVAAFKPDIRNPIFKILSLVLVNGLFMVFVVLCLFTGQSDPFAPMHKTLLDPRFLPKQASRTFIYSVQDRIVNWQAVEDFVKKTSELGIPVVREKYETTEHVRHIKGDPDRYWAIAKL